MYRDILPSEIKLDVTLGYEYFLDTNHPLGSVSIGRVYYHRHVASINLGRWLLPNEVVHHKDGNKQNNYYSNLEVMDATTHGRLHGHSELHNKVCPVCLTTFVVTDSKIDRITCSEVCKGIRSRNPVSSISKEELEKLIWTHPYTCVASMLGLSDNGVRRRAKSLGCLMPPSRFHLKSYNQRKEIASKYCIPL